MENSTQLNYIISFMEDNNIQLISWDWGDCPLEEKHELGHGGDEDYVMLHLTNDWKADRIVDQVTICCHNNKIINNKYSLSVTAHA